jgi:bacillopeptidase F
MKLKDTLLSVVIALILGWSGSTVKAEMVKIDSHLLTAIDSANEEDFIDVLLIVADGGRISMETARLARKRPELTGRYRAVYHQLQEKTATSQSDLINLLRDKTASGSVAEFKSYWIANVIYLRAQPAEIMRLASRDDVEQIISDFAVGLIEPVAKSTAAAAQTGAADNLVAVGARALWDRGLTGAGRLICSFDTGVKGDHPALAAKWRGNYTADTAACWFDPFGATFPADASGHGTHVMGIMVGHDGADTIGLALDAQWISAGVIDRGRALPQTMSDILNAFQWAANPDGDPETFDDVPDVVCNSWGIPSGFMKPCDQKFWEAIDNLESLGIVCIFAAGNEGPNSETMRNPASRSSSPTNTFAVGAVDASDPALPVAGFSSRGPSSCDFSKKKPEVVAPGVGIRSSYKDGSYKLISGTSMAAPHVAAAVALFRQYNPNLTPEQIKSAILLSAIDVEDPGEDNESGMGFIDLAAAFELLPEPAIPEPRVEDVVFADGENKLLDPGEAGYLVITLHNEASAAENLVGYLFTVTPGVQIDKGTAWFGAIGFNEMGDNVGDPFIISTAPSFELGDTINFTLTLLGDGILGYLEREFSLLFGVPFNGEWSTLDFGAVAMTVSNFGVLGLHNDSYAPLGGRGYDIPADGGNHLYEAGLVLTADNKVSDEIRNASSGKYNGDFKPSMAAGMAPFSPGTIGDQELETTFTDSGAVDPLGITVRQRAAAFGAAPGDRCILLEYVLTNTSGMDIAGLRVGLFSDWDIPGDYLTEQVVVDVEEALFYQHGDNRGPVVGVVTLNARMTAARFFNNGPGKRGFSDAEKVAALRGTVEPPDENEVADWCGFIAAGPYDLGTGDSITVAFALCSSWSCIRIIPTRSTR